MKDQRKVIRLAEYNYDSQGAYFITICAHQRMNRFGKITATGESALPGVCLSTLGELVDRNISRISTAYPVISVEKYVIMPNHIHLLLLVTDEYRNDSTRRDKMLIAKAMQSFKASVSRQYKSAGEPIWQARYYDHVIRSDDEFLRIWQYIANNPARWAEDCYHTL